MFDIPLRIHFSSATFSQRCRNLCRIFSVLVLFFCRRRQNAENARYITSARTSSPTSAARQSFIRRFFSAAAGSQPRRALCPLTVDVGFRLRPDSRAVSSPDKGSWSRLSVRLPADSGVRHGNRERLSRGRESILRSPLSFSSNDPCRPFAARADGHNAEALRPALLPPSKRDPFYVLGGG